MNEQCYVIWSKTVNDQILGQSDRGRLVGAQTELNNSILPDFPRLAKQLSSENDCPPSVKLHTNMVVDGSAVSVGLVM